jgi:copper chaperone CopZ
MESRSYSVPGMYCSHCEAAVKGELEGIRGVQTVEVDLEAKVVTIGGEGLDEASLVAAIDEAGYDAEPIPA